MARHLTQRHYIMASQANPVCTNSKERYQTVPFLLPSQTAQYADGCIEYSVTALLKRPISEPQVFDYRDIIHYYEDEKKFFSFDKLLNTEQRSERQDPSLVYEVVTLYKD